MVYSWGRFHRTPQTVDTTYWGDEPWISVAAPNAPTFLPYGNGHTFGDACLNSTGTLLSTRGLNRILSFDAEDKSITCSSGITLGELAEFLLPKGLFFAAVPNSTHITVGGAIAADAHGRNHVSRGSFGHHVQAIELVRTDGPGVRCSREENAELFRATVGGQGLTGLICRTTLKLRSIPSGWVEGRKTKVESLDELMSSLPRINSEFEYVSTWLQLRPGPRAIRGIVTAANHVTGDESGVENKLKPIAKIHGDFPRPLLGRMAAHTFNSFVYHATKPGALRSRLMNFMFTLDQIENWNRLFGKKGFLHFHFVLPDASRDALPRILDEMRNSGEIPFLSVLKTFGKMPPVGHLSFPMAGVMVATDFKYRGEETIRSFRRWENLVTDAGGRVYLAKDAVMTSQIFKRSYPQWTQVERLRDPRIISDMWKRVTK